jgi:hypothetical protein
VYNPLYCPKLDMSIVACDCISFDKPTTKWPVFFTFLVLLRILQNWCKHLKTAIFVQNKAWHSHETLQEIISKLHITAILYEYPTVSLLRSRFRGLGLCRGDFSLQYPPVPHYNRKIYCIFCAWLVLIINRHANYGLWALLYSTISKNYGNITATIFLLIQFCKR